MRRQQVYVKVRSLCTRNAPSTGSERVDHIGKCQTGLWDAIVFSSKITSCNHSSDISRDPRHGLNQPAMRISGPDFTIMPAYSVVQP